MDVLKEIKTALTLLFIFSILTGLIYPAVVTALAQTFFHWRANGSLIQQNNQLVGSELIGQSFTDNQYFWSRPSATTPYPYNAQNSSGSNLGPSNPDFLTTVKNRVTNLQKTGFAQNGLVPVDLVTASASGVDPDISPFAAYYQIARVAAARHLPEKSLQQLVQRSIQKRTFGILGECRVNVLQLNLALDQLTKDT